MPRRREINPLIPGASLEIRKPSERIEAVLHDTLEMAGQRSLEESTALLQERLAAIRRRKIKSEGRISEAENISEIKTGKEKKLSEGAICHLTVEDDAVILNASDAHGSFSDLKKAITEFVARREKGEHIYFNFSGDISSGDIDEIIPCMEALASIQARYPKEVTIELGNGDRRGISLLMGMAREATQRFSPELHQYLKEKTQQKFNKFCQEQNIDPKKAGRIADFFYGSELLKLARLAGTEPLNPHEFNPNSLTRLVKGMTKVERSRQLGEMIRNFRLAIEPLRPWDKRQAQKYNPKILTEAQKIFEYWKLADRVLNEQPALAIYENQDSVVLATHSGFVGRGGKLGDLVYNPLRVDQAVWSKIIHQEKGEKPGKVEKYNPGVYFSFTPEFQGQLLERILPENKIPLLVVGHNHGNFTERIPVGKRNMLRVENCISSHKKRAGEEASFVEIKLADLAKNPSEPEKAVKFVKIKESET